MTWKVSPDGRSLKWQCGSSAEANKEQLVFDRVYPSSLPMSTLFIDGIWSLARLTLSGRCSNVIIVAPPGCASTATLRGQLEESQLGLSFALVCMVLRELTARAAGEWALLMTWCCFVGSELVDVLRNSRTPLGSTTDRGVAKKGRGEDMKGLTEVQLSTQNDVLDILQFACNGSGPEPREHDSLLTVAVRKDDGQPPGILRMYLLPSKDTTPTPAPAQRQRSHVPQGQSALGVSPLAHAALTAACGELTPLQLYIDFPAPQAGSASSVLEQKIRGCFRPSQRTLFIAGVPRECADSEEVKTLLRVAAEIRGAATARRSSRDAQEVADDADLEQEDSSDLAPQHPPAAEPPPAAAQRKSQGTGQPQSQASWRGQTMVDPNPRRRSYARTQETSPQSAASASEAAVQALRQELREMQDKFAKLETSEAAQQKSLHHKLQLEATVAAASEELVAQNGVLSRNNSLLVQELETQQRELSRSSNLLKQAEHRSVLQETQLQNLEASLEEARSDRLEATTRLQAAERRHQEVELWYAASLRESEANLAAASQQVTELRRAEARAVDATLHRTSRAQQAHDAILESEFKDIQARWKSRMAAVEEVCEARMLTVEARFAANALNTHDFSEVPAVWNPCGIRQERNTELPTQAWPWELQELVAFLEASFGSLDLALAGLARGGTAGEAVANIGTNDAATTQQVRGIDWLQFSDGLHRLGFVVDSESVEAQGDSTLLLRLWSALDSDGDGQVCTADFHNALKAKQAR